MPDSFDDGPFGRKEWSYDVLVGLLPEIYVQTDNEVDGGLVSLLESIVPSFDEFYDKISFFGDLRDPLRCPTNSAFTESVLIIKVEDLGDGTSRVFLSQGSDGKVFDGIKIGYNLKDPSGNLFEIITKNSSELPSDFSSPPIDPFTGNPTGKNIIVNNVTVGGLEVIPLVSGHTYQTTGTNASAPANGVSPIANLTVSPIDDGVNTGPYACTVALPPIAPNLITVEWTESSNQVFGYFNDLGQAFGQLGVGSSVNYNTGVVTVVPLSGNPVDFHSIKITYTTLLAEDLHPVTVPPIDGVSVGPYVFTLPLPPLNAYRVIFYWTESSVAHTGLFNSSGTPVADLHASSTINFTTGTISFKSATGIPVDAGSLDVWYWPVNSPLTADATVSAPNFLVYLGRDYDVDIDQNEPESFQRSSVYNAYQLWDIKGSERGYEVMGNLHGFTVRPRQLYRINMAFADTFRTAGFTVYEFPGLTLNETTGATPPGSIFPPNDGVNVGPFAIYVTYPPICTTNTTDNQPRITLTWTEASTLKTLTYNSHTATTSGDIASISAFSLITVGSDTVGVNVTFAGGHAPQAGSLQIKYIQSAFYTTIAPFTLYMDEVVLDAIPLDTYCADTDFPVVHQPVTLTAATQIVAHEDGVSRWSVTATTSESYLSFGTEGYLQSAPTVLIENFQRLSNTLYSFEVVQTSAPVLGSDTMVWHALKELPEIETDKPGITSGSTISPAPNGATLGPFTIDLANYPLTTDILTINWHESTVAKTATLSGTTTLGGANAANIASASINRTTGVLTITFAMGHAPDAIGAGSISIVYDPISDFSIVGVGTDLFSLGQQYYGYTGIRYRLYVTTSEPISVASVGHWKLIDSNGIQFWIERSVLVYDPTVVGFVSPPGFIVGPHTSRFQYALEFVAGSVPATGPANLLYSCAEIPSCIYCAASGLTMTIDANTILNYPESADYVSSGAAVANLETRLNNILPAHVRVVNFMVH